MLEVSHSCSSPSECWIRTLPSSQRPRLGKTTKNVTGKHFSHAQFSDDSCLRRSICVVRDDSSSYQCFHFGQFTQPSFDRSWSIMLTSTPSNFLLSSTPTRMATVYLIVNFIDRNFCPPDCVANRKSVDTYVLVLPILSRVTP